MLDRTQVICDHTSMKTTKTSTTSGAMVAHIAGVSFNIGLLDGLSTADDVDSRTGSRRRLVDTYELHADHLDQVRCCFSESIRTIVGYLADGGKSNDYWVDELWMIDRTLRALGIED